MIEINDITFGYFPNEKLFNNFSYSIVKGDRLAVVGDNGAGKSTFLRLINTSLRPQRGVINTYGSIGSIMSGYGNFRGEFTGIDLLLITKIKYSLNFTLTQFTSIIMDKTELNLSLLKRPLYTWSTGQKMRMALILFLYSDYNIILMDEYLGGVDKNFLKIYNKDLTKKLKDSDILVFATHDKAIIDSLANRILAL